MDAFASSPQERMEVELVLRSGIFEKAPRLEHFFLYICRLHFEGRADEIKEYSIAIEALGRSPDFDPKKDSIVRVEAHRLRKRLEEYYCGPGSRDDVRIVIPNGQYRPHFIPRRDDAPSKPVVPAEILAVSEIHSVEKTPMDLQPTTPLRAQVFWRHRSARWFVPLAVLIWASALAFSWRLSLDGKLPLPANHDEKWSGPATEPVSEEFRMLTGYHGPPFVDQQGHTWNSDAYFAGGTSKPLPAQHFIEGQPDARLLQTNRSGHFQYDIPLRQGSHELHLYFAETEYGQGNPLGGGEASRIFRISINGVPTFAAFDPLASAGAPNRLHQRVLKDVVPAADGKLHISFDPVTAPAILNAIEILRTLPGRIHPIRIVTQGSPVTDSEGHFWAADEFFCGGVQASRHSVVINPREKVLYHGERYGNFSYRLPLAPGEYRLTLHFAETWFGTPESHEPATDGRIFDVFANGVSLLTDYQIALDAGGPNRSVEKVFEHLKPNAQGELILQFIPIKNYAEVNAIEVIETN
jgi:hypothetical protein